MHQMKPMKFNSYFKIIIGKTIPTGFIITNSLKRSLCVLFTSVVGGENNLENYVILRILEFTLHF